MLFALPKQGLLSPSLLPQSVMLESRLVIVSLKDAQLFAVEGCGAKRQFANNEKKKSNRRSWRSPLSHTVHEHATPRNLGHELLQTTINLPHLVILIWSTNSMWPYEFASVKYLSRNQDTFCLSQCAPSPSLASLDEL